MKTWARLPFVAAAIWMLSFNGMAPPARRRRVDGIATAREGR